MTDAEPRFCDRHAYVRDDETTLGDPYADREAAAKDCPACKEASRGE